jgi:hypothetical protein
MRLEYSDNLRTKGLSLIQGLPDCGGVRAEPPLKVFVTDDRHDWQAWSGRGLGSWSGRRRLWTAIIIDKIAAQHNPGTHKLEVVRGHDAQVRLFGHAVLTCERYGKCENACQALEFALGRFAQINEICVRKGEALDTAISQVAGDNDQLIGLLVRQGTEQHSVGDTKNGRTRAYAQGDGQCSRERKDGTLSQSSPSKGQIAEWHLSTSFTSSGRAEDTTSVIQSRHRDSSEPSSLDDALLDCLAGLASPHYNATRSSRTLSCFYPADQFSEGETSP